MWKLRRTGGNDPETEIQRLKKNSRRDRVQKKRGKARDRRTQTKTTRESHVDSFVNRAFQSFLRIFCSSGVAGIRKAAHHSSSVPVVKSTGQFVFVFVFEFVFAVVSVPVFRSVLRGG